MSLLLKWWWRYKCDGTGLWKKVIESIHHNERAWAFLPIKASIPGVWNSINKVGKDFEKVNIRVENLFKGVTGNGLHTRFWLDCWLGETPLRYTFPNLFALESNKGCSVAARLSVPGNFQGGGWAWKREPLQVLERDELAACNNLIRTCTLSSARDEWKWLADSSGSFTTASCRDLLAANAAPFYPFKWSSWVPKKVNILAWRAEQDRLSTMEGLIKRNIVQSSPLCSLCGDYPENADHLLIHCYVASNIWQKVAEWCNISPIFAFNFRELLESSNINGLKKSKKKALYAIILTTCWIIWKGRNDKIFRGKKVNYEELLSEIKAQSHLWITNRAKEITKDWGKWRSFDI
ncbi:uncharacterized protein LOC110943906 [Helianthus annuus]|uniref:uncharacterized protein LOC110943906 n=1 Tax=Helianthus annuus TaxID=4232 RepID=UPI000B9024E3|nr:uncharacterized protein LOC110943906 [Helianthus annuus]